MLNRCLSVMVEKCISGPLDPNGDNIAGLGAGNQFESLHRAEQERSNQTLGEKLGQTNGVICPPDIDKGMKAPTPYAGKTPVIPPPDSPGGNPNVQPK